MCQIVLQTIAQIKPISRLSSKILQQVRGGEQPGARAEALRGEAHRGGQAERPPPARRDQGGRQDHQEADERAGRQLPEEPQRGHDQPVL